MAKEVVKTMDKNFLVFLVLIAGIGGWYCYVAFGVLAIAILKNKNKKEVKQEK